MSETIITKRCSKCKEIKPVTEFFKNRTTKDGFQYQCKTCFKIYKQSDKGKIANRKSAKKIYQTEKGKAYKKQYDQSEIGIAIRKRASNKHSKTDKCKKRHRKYCLKNPEKRHAKNAANSAVLSGKLPRPDTLKCHYCPVQAEHYHHPSYKPEHWLDVIPVCVPCHYKIHSIP